MDERIICTTTDSIEVLNLSVRVHNALKRAKYWDVGEVIEVSDDQLFAVHNLGEKGIAEIRERLSRVELLDAPPAIESEPTKAWSGHPHILIDLGPPTIPRHTVVEWQQLMLARQIEAKLLHPKLTVNGRTLVELRDSHRNSEGLYEQLLKVLLGPITISQELEHILQSSPARELDILVRRLGYKQQTLAAVASAMEVTRERVRQLQIQGTSRLLHASKSLPLVRIRSAVLFADDMDLSFNGWTELLLRTGLLGQWTNETFSGYDRIEVLITICNLSRESDSAITIPQSLAFMLRLHDQDKSSHAAKSLYLSELLTKDQSRLLRKHLRHSGAVSLEWLAEKLQYTLLELQDILEARDFHAVGDQWYMSTEFVPVYAEKSDVFHRTLFKTFAFCGPLTVDEVMYGLEHALSRTDFPVPPVDVISTVLEEYGYSNDSGKWFWEGSISEGLNSGEKVILRTIFENNGVAHHSKLARAFIESPLSFPSLHGTLSRSPLFDNFEKGLYKLRGERPSSRYIQSAVTDKETIPVDLEHHFNMDGNIVVQANLGILALGNGTIVSERLPALMGKWRLCRNDKETREIEVTQNEVRGLRQTLQLLRCKVGDRIKMIFDTDTRQVLVSRIEKTA